MSGSETPSGWDELAEIATTIEPVAGKATREHVERIRRAHDELMQQFAADSAGLDDDERERVQGTLLVLTERAAAIAIAAGERATADRLLDAALKLARTDDERGLLRAATLAREEFRALIHGGYLMARGDEPIAVEVWTNLRDSAPDEVLRRAAAEAIDGPRPLGSVPSLERWNGIGGGIYGRREVRPDGSYITTHCWVFLGIPLFPTSAYRVEYMGSDTYRFMSRERLSRFARAARIVVPLLIVLAITAGAIAAYLYDPDRAAKRTFDRALALEQGGDPEQALAALDQALATVDLSRVGDRPVRAGAAIVRLSAGYVPAPFERDAVDQAHRVVMRYQALPDEARGGVAQDAIVAALEGWIAALDASEDLDARLVLLRDGLAVSGTMTFSDRIWATRRGIAVARAKEYPLEALAVLVGEPQDPALIELANPNIDELIDAPSLLDEARDDVAAWVAATPTSDPRHALVSNARVLGLEARADAEDPSLTPEALAKLQAKRPWDQRVALRLAEIDLAAGKTDAARQRLRAFGSPGRLIRDAVFLLAQVEMGDGALETADALLSRLLASRQQRFLDARAALDAAGVEFDRQLNARARANALPADLLDKLERAGEAEQQKLFQAWAAEEAEKDPKLVAARERYYSYGDVVQFSLALGTVKLRRAQAVAGAARDEMLADAERAFLAIRTEAEGQPEFHLGLGEVYARLGKTEESDAELQALLDRDEPQLSLSVAYVYRSIGSTERAAAIGKKVFAKASGDLRNGAAVLMSLLANTEDERAEWLGKADPELPFVRTGLLEIEGYRAMRRGKHAECDRAFTQAAKEHLKNAASDPATSFNNAALSQQARFFCKGDLSALADAEATLERAYRAQPDSAVLVGNLAGVLAGNAELRVLASRLDLGVLRPNGGDLDLLLDALLHGSERETILAELAADPGMRRSAELTDQQQVLAPNRPDSYERAIERARRNRDEAAMTEALARLRGAKNLDTSDAAAGRARWIAGELDDKLLETVTATLARTDEVVDRAKLDVRTRAAAHMIAAGARLQRAAVEGDPEDAAKAGAHLVSAAELWPALEVSGALARALLDEVGSRADAERWVEGRRIRTAAELLTRWAAAGDPLVEKVKASPQWAEMRALVIADTTRPGLDDWRLAQLVGDGAAIERTRSALGDPIVRMQVEANLLLQPGDETLVEDQALLEAR